MAPPIRPMLGEIELQQVQLIQLDEDQVLTRHDVPALEGDFFQRLGQAGAAIELTGVQSGPEAREGLNGLREAYRAAAPLTFAADIVSATDLEDVLIERFEIAEQAGLPDAFEYRLRLREYTEAPEPEPEVPPPPPPPPPVTEDEGVLVVTVIKEGDPGFDPSGVNVTVAGTTQDGEEINDRPLTNREDNRWTEDPFPAGSFTVRAAAPGAAADGGDLSGVATAAVRAGETTEVEIVLRDTAALALRFLVHFRFDSAFVEPCLKHVLRQVAGFAADNPDMRLVTVGHTDLTGSNAYNQSLSERRARSVFAMLRFGNDPQAAIDEWNEIRQMRTPGTTLSLRDSWGTREYQQMLQDRGFYQGRIDGDHGPLTDTAVRDFQTANGLPPTGAMNGATWPVLIEAYLSAENLSVPDDRFLPNCPGEILKWLGCGELDPVRNETFAWRPNRRTELLFTRATDLPADVAEPDTVNLPSPGSVAGGWCLNDSGTTTRCCFVEPNLNSARHETCPGTLPRGDPLTRQAAEPSPSFVVQGSIRFEDGTPYTGAFFITAPDGEYMDGERPSSSGSGRAGTPLRRHPEADGSFQYPDKPKTPGIFILELDADVVARPVGAPLSEAKGPVVCMRLASGADHFDVVIVDRSVAEVVPRIELPRPVGAPPTGGPGTDPVENVVVLKRAHTSPARRPVVFLATPSFEGTGTVTIEQGADKVRLFDALVGGNELTFDGTDNVFSGTDFELLGIRLFAEGGPTPSAALDDVEIKLQLTVNGSPGFSTTRSLTTVRLTLDITEDPLFAALDPPVLPEAEKINPGRPLQVQNIGRNAQRILLLVRRAEPAAFAGNLELNRINQRVALFGSADEIPAAGQTPVTLPHSFANTSVPETAPPVREIGLRFFAEGAQISAAARDTGFQLGIAGLEPDGDRVIVTTSSFEIVNQATAAAAAVDFVRVGLWDNAFNTTTGALLNGVAEAANFVGSDTRHFFARAVDLNGGAEIDAEWGTRFGDQSDDDVRPGVETITLPPLTGAANTYVSRALMLVTDTQDRNQATNSGLAAPHLDAGARTLGQSNHRLRRITVSDAHPLDHETMLEYSPGGFGGRRYTMRASNPVFDRAPEDRRRIRVHLINVRDVAGGTGALTNARRTHVSDTMRAIYAVCGIFAEVDETVIDPPASCTGWPTRYTDAIAVDPAVEGFTLPGANLAASPSQNDLIDAVRALPTFDANDIYIVFVARIYAPPIPAPATPPAGGLVAGSRGQSFPDAWVAAGATSAGFTFVGVRGGVTDFTEVHEVTHVTTDLRNSVGGHLDLPAANVTDRSNLMHNGTIDTAGVASTKRLWNTNFNNPGIAPPLIPAQIDAIRASRYVRPF
ncbi:peptidoglycan-binding protein [Roseobacter sp. YSTF-M11]|uniref:Peptidoglycan-binding protein n=1 Tax=Roseobacter insulae TaxID=2859783 RepID=A0A9X1FZ79_9RHOB|nr:peptidoglycan-binding protein [Roseobacter insulae]MBW4710439.1 peptidoglycan-binding protein [Roseobacter insulae]